MGDLLRGLLKGAIGPADNDSRFLLDVHSRDLPGEKTMRRYRDDDEVDLVVVGAGAGGSVLAQRLARRGLAGRDPGGRPVLAPRRGLGVRRGRLATPCTGRRSASSAATTRSRWARTTPGAGWAGRWSTTPATAPRFHPSDFQTHTLDGVGADWPIGYDDIRGHYERVERELPVAGQNWPWGYPASLPPFATSHLGRGREAVAGRDAARHRDAGRARRHRQRHVRQPPALHLPRLLPAGLQGQRQGQPVRHAPARRAGPRRRDPRRTAWPPASNSTRPAPRAGWPTTTRSADANGCNGRKVVAVAGYSIETPAAAAELDQRSLPERAGQQRRPGRALRDGAGRRRSRRADGPTSCACTRRRPPRCPPSSSTRPIASRGFARGFSIQTVSPLPIGWAEHVLAEGHWGRALREYMRDYNHWATVGVLNELLPQPDNRVTPGRRDGPVRHPGRPVRLHACATTTRPTWRTPPA